MRVKVSGTAPIRRAARWVPALGWMAGIFWLSQQSAPLGVRGGEQASTLAHLALYTGLALLLSFALAKDGRCELRWLVPSIAFAVAVLYGTLDEVHQSFVAGRTASDADLGVDAAGAALGVCLALLPSFAWARRR